jgi:5-methylcytosine-specific restriction protein A
MPLRECLDCRTLTRNGTRCPTCKATQERTRPQRPTNLTRTWAERQRRAQAVEEHRQARGNWCPGWQVPPHPSSDLTADHVDAVATGGHPHGPLIVLCRSCNGRKGSTQPVGGPPSTG